MEGFENIPMVDLNNQYLSTEEYLHTKGDSINDLLSFPIYDQEAFRDYLSKNFKLQNTEA